VVGCTPGEFRGISDGFDRFASVLVFLLIQIVFFHHHLLLGQGPQRGEVGVVLQLLVGDSKFSYSPIQSVKLPEEKGSISVYPNPANSYIFVEGLNADSSGVEIYLRISTNIIPSFEGFMESLHQP
jgi:hypothetical protein